MLTSKYTETLFDILVVGVLSALAFKLTFYFHTNWAEIVEANIDITEGRADWRAFQNRVMGPLWTAHQAS